jgi:hypothetical protein
MSARAVFSNLIFFLILANQSVAFAQSPPDWQSSNGRGDTRHSQHSTCNQPPLAIIALADAVQSGDSVVLDGTGSHDPDGEIKKYHWRAKTLDRHGHHGRHESWDQRIDIDDRSSATASFVAPNVAQPTTVLVKLTVIDNNGTSHTASKKVVVYPVPPKLSVLSPRFNGHLDLGPEGTGTGTFVISGTVENAHTVLIRLDGEELEAEIDKSVSPNQWQAEVGANQSGESTYEIVAVGIGGEDSQDLTLVIEKAKPEDTLYTSDYAPVTDFIRDNFLSYDQDAGVLHLATLELPEILRKGTVITIPSMDGSNRVAYGRVLDISESGSETVVQLEKAGLKDIFNQLAIGVLLELPVNMLEQPSMSILNARGEVVQQAAPEDLEIKCKNFTDEDGYLAQIEDTDIGLRDNELWAQRCIPFLLDYRVDLLSTEDKNVVGFVRAYLEGRFIVENAITIKREDHGFLGFNVGIPKIATISSHVALDGQASFTAEADGEYETSKQTLTLANISVYTYGLKIRKTDVELGIDVDLEPTLTAQARGNGQAKIEIPAWFKNYVDGSYSFDRGEGYTDYDTAADIELPPKIDVTGTLTLETGLEGRFTLGIEGLEYLPFIPNDPNLLYMGIGEEAVFTATGNGSGLQEKRLQFCGLFSMGSPSINTVPDSPSSATSIGGPQGELYRDCGDDVLSGGGSYGGPSGRGCTDQELVTKVKERLLQGILPRNRKGLLDSEAESAACSCIETAEKGGYSAADFCLSGPIFYSGHKGLTSNEVQQNPSRVASFKPRGNTMVTEHISDTLKLRPDLSRLTFRDTDRSGDAWYWRTAPGINANSDNPLAVDCTQFTGAADAEQTVGYRANCDEFAFGKSEQGYDSNKPNPQANVSTRIVPAVQNSSHGAMYGQFASACPEIKGDNKRDFLVVPLERAQFSDSLSFWTCSATDSGGGVIAQDPDSWGYLPGEPGGDDGTGDGGTGDGGTGDGGDNNDDGLHVEFLVDHVVCNGELVEFALISGADPNETLEYTLPDDSVSTGVANAEGADEDPLRWRCTESSAGQRLDFFAKGRTSGKSVAFSLDLAGAGAPDDPDQDTTPPPEPERVLVKIEATNIKVVNTEFDGLGSEEWMLLFGIASSPGSVCSDYNRSAEFDAGVPVAPEGSVITVTPGQNALRTGTDFICVFEDIGNVKEGQDQSLSAVIQSGGNVGDNLNLVGSVVDNDIIEKYNSDDFRGDFEANLPLPKAGETTTVNYTSSTGDYVITLRISSEGL